MTYLDNSFEPVVPILTNPDYVVTAYTIYNELNEIFIRTYTDTSTYTCSIVENESQYVYSENALIGMMDDFLADYNHTQ